MSQEALSNWARRVIDSRGSHFRMDTGSPKNGLDGPETAKIYCTNDNGEVFLVAHGQGSGLGRIACDKTIEIRAGDKNNPDTIDIRISAATGDITINADRGRVRVNAKNVMVEASQDLDLKAGRNINLQCGTGRILLKGNTISSSGKRGNLVPKSWGDLVFEGSFVPTDILTGVFSPAAQITALGSAAGGFGGIAGAAAGAAGAFASAASGGGIGAIANTALSAVGGKGALGTIGSLASSALSGNVGGLAAGAAKALGVASGSNALTGLTQNIGTGTLGKGAAGTIGNFSGDDMASLDGIAPDAEIQSYIDFEQSLGTDVDAEIDDVFGSSDEARRLLAGETVDGVSFELE